MKLNSTIIHLQLFRSCEYVLPNVNSPSYINWTFVAHYSRNTMPRHGRNSVGQLCHSSFRRNVNTDTVWHAWTDDVPYLRYQLCCARYGNSRVNTYVWLLGNIYIRFSLSLQLQTQHFDKTFIFKVQNMLRGLVLFCTEHWLHYCYRGVLPRRFAARFHLIRSDNIALVFFW